MRSPCLTTALLGLIAALAGPAFARVGLEARVSSERYRAVDGQWLAICGPIITPDCATITCDQGGGRTASGDACAGYGFLRARASASTTGDPCRGTAIAEFKDEIVVIGRATNADVTFSFDVLGTAGGPSVACGTPDFSPGPTHRATLSIAIPDLGYNVCIPVDPNADVVTFPPVENLVLGTVYDISVRLHLAASSGYGTADGPNSAAIDYFTGDRALRLRPLVVESNGQPVGLARARGRSCHQYLGPAPAAVMHVKTNGDDSADGATWATAIRSLQDALLLAKLPCGVQSVWLARGTYLPGPEGSRAAAFFPVNAVPIYGGFAGHETDPAQRDIAANPTILSGDLGQNDDRGIYTDNAWHVVHAHRGAGPLVDHSVVLDGLTISGGNADAADPHSNTGEGAGIRSWEAGLTLRNCTLRDNRARAGAAISCISWGALTIDNCTFADNSAVNVVVGSANGGGALYAGVVPATISRSSFLNNRGLYAGGAIYSGAPLTVSRCTFADNTAVYNGNLTGGGSVRTAAAAAFLDCRFTRNTASSGGAVSSGLARGLFVTFDRCTFENNSASDGSGGAVHGALLNAGTSGGGYTFRDCSFFRNSAARGVSETSDGGAAFFDLRNALFAAFSDCLFAGNSAVNRGGALYGVDSVSASRFYGNSATGAGSAGGAVYTSANASIADSAFVANSALGSGGALRTFFGQISVVNSTVVGNSAPSGGGISTTLPHAQARGVHNTILWANTGGQIVCPATFPVSSCVVQGGLSSGTRIFNADPLVVLPSPGPDTLWGTADDVLTVPTLQPTSPCIDTGDNTRVPPNILTDLVKLPRFVDDLFTADQGISDPARPDLPIVDIGAIEHRPAPIRLPPVTAGVR